MSKLSLEALKERAEAVVSEELLANITGGEENACHDSQYQQDSPRNDKPADATYVHQPRVIRDIQE